MTVVWTAEERVRLTRSQAETSRLRFPLGEGCK